MIWVSVALAQDIPPIAADSFRPSIDNPWMIQVDESGHGDRWHSNARELFSYSARPLAYTDADGDVTPLIGHVQREDTLAATTFGRFRLGTRFPYYAFLSGEGDDRGRGNLELELKGTALERDDRPVGLAFTGAVSLPTATALGLGHQDVGWELSTIADQHVGDWLIATNLGYRGVPRVETAELVWDDQVLFRAGAAYKGLDDLGAAVEWTSAFGIEGGPASRQMELTASGWVDLGERFQTRLALSKGLSRGVGVPRARAVWVVAYEPERAVGDTDGDGLTDDRDVCPEVPEDGDGWREEDGCPEPTRVTLRFADPDGIPLVGLDVTVDGQPYDAGVNLQAGDHQVTASGRGILPKTFTISVPEGPPIELSETLGLEDPGVIEPRIIDPSGKPIRGATWVLGDEDQGERRTTEVVAGGYRVAAMADGYLPRSKQIEVVAGRTSTVLLTLEPTTVRVTATRIEIGDRIYFETGKAAIRPESADLLDDIATTIIEHPEIVRLRIEGHTDSRADDAFNQALSEDRAQAVKQALVDRGVDPGRLDAQGYGETRPIDSRNIPEAWDQNRRVDFVITDRK